MAARKSMVYLNSMLPVTITEDDLIKQKLKPGKFVLTITGNIKVVGVLCLLASVAIMLAAQSYCESAQDYWYLTFIVNWLALIVAFTLYLIFSFGMTVKKPVMWVRIDIGVNLVLSVLTIVSSILSTSLCNENGSFANVPGPLGILGGVLLLISCASIFLMYRYQENEDVPRVAPAPKTPLVLSRKSIFA